MRCCANLPWVPGRVPGAFRLWRPPLGKRSSFERKERDYYPTIDHRALPPLLPFLKGHRTFCEPCAGAGDLIRIIPLRCVSAFDIAPGVKGVRRLDALRASERDLVDAELIITNPPWSRHLLHPLILHLSGLRPTWLLLDADWKHTKQATELLKRCSDVVSVGRLKWIPGSKNTGKDNCCWYRFQDTETETTFHGRQ